MSNKNDHDIYIIPPNFIESGTFFGGMFRARNVIEAGMKGCGYGVREIAKSEKLPVRCIKDLLEEAHVVFLELCRE